MNKSKLEDDIYHGGHAESLLANPAYQAAMMRLKAGLFEQFGDTGLFQKRKREALWRMTRVAEKFESELEQMIRDASIAKEDLKQLEKNQKSKR